MSDEKKEVELQDLKANGEKKEKKEEVPTSPHAQMLFHAIKGDVDAMRKCYQEGGRVNVPDEGPVIAQTETDGKKKKGPEKIPNQHITGDYALHAAVGNGHLMAAKEIVLWEADLESHNRIGSTPLHRACSHGQIELVAYLLQQGASIDAKNKIGNTPLHCAAFCGHVEVAKLLLEANATAHLKTPNNIGYTPLSFAKQGGKSMAQLLLNYKPDTTKKLVTERKSRISVDKKPLTPTTEVDEDKINPKEKLTKTGESSSREPSLLGVPASEPKTDVDGSRSGAEISKSEERDEDPGTPS